MFGTVKIFFKMIKEIGMTKRSNVTMINACYFLTVIYFEFHVLQSFCLYSGLYWVCIFVLKKMNEVLKPVEKSCRLV